MKTACGDVIILNLSNKRHNKMMYAYSDMECNRNIFCHFRPFFALLPHYWPQKLKFGKNVKNRGDIILLHICTINDLWFLRYKVQKTKFFYHYGPFFALSPSQQPKKPKFWKNKKKTLEILLFSTCVPQMATI